MRSSQLRPGLRSAGLPPPLIANLIANLIAMLVAGRAAAADLPPGPQAPQPPPAQPTPPELLGWTHHLHPGAFFTSVFVSQDADAAPDPTIQGSANALAYRVVFDGALAWRGERSTVDQSLHLAYGQVKQSYAG